MDVTVIISTGIGAIIGTFGGAYFLSWRSESGLRKVRESALAALNLFKTYGAQEKSYLDASSEFNRTFNIAEKRSFLVALYKIGIPIAAPRLELFNIKNISFLDEHISINAIEDMKSQISSGTCDHLFFQDVEKFFDDDLRIRTQRDIAIRFINKVAKKSTVDISTRIRRFPDNWESELSFGELNTMLVFQRKINDSSFYTSTGQPKEEAFNKLIEEVKIGLWDKYFNTDELEYGNLQAQYTAAQVLTQGMSQQTQANSPKCKNYVPDQE